MKVVYLKPIGGYKTDLRSDTLWGLLCWGLRHLHGEERLKQFIQSYLDGKPELTISSAFPYKQVEGKRVKFFPKPLLPPPPPGSETYADMRFKYQLRKELKKQYWINEQDFAAVLGGGLTNKDFERRLKEQLEHPEKEPSAVQIPPKRSVETITHTTIDRVQLSTHAVFDPDTNESRGQLFQSDEIHWEDPTDDSQDSDKTGLFFLAEGDDSWLLPVLRLYRHLGLGGNRTTGKGFFEPSVSEFILPQTEGANALLNLSLYHPSAVDLKALQANASPLFRYLLEERKGKVGFLKGRFEKNPVTYFKEGSVFPAACFEGKTSIGQLVPQALPVGFPVYDNGVGFFLKIKI